MRASVWSTLSEGSKRMLLSAVGGVLYATGSGLIQDEPWKVIIGEALIAASVIGGAVRGGEVLYDTARQAVGRVIPGDVQPKVPTRTDETPRVMRRREPTIDY